MGNRRDASAPELATTRVTIRDFRDGDERSIASLFADSARASNRYLDPDWIHAVNHDRTQLSVVAELGNEIVGHYAQYHWPGCSVAKGTALLVTPRARRLGIAQRLMEANLKRARGLGRRAFAISVKEGRTPVRRLVDSAGFVQTARLAEFGPEMARVSATPRAALRSRGARAFAVLVWDRRPRRPWVPPRYGPRVHGVYEKLGLRTDGPRLPPPPASVHVHVDPALRYSRVTVCGEGEGLPDALRAAVAQAVRPPTEIAYVDINIERTPAIEDLGVVLGEHRFVYAGLLPLFDRDEDLLRFQYIAPRAARTGHKSARRGRARARRVVTA